ncbi:MAG: hypothetical protein P8X74_22060, partial [Reinekea sp.]
GGLMTETYHWATGNGFDGSMLAGALKDGYDGEGAGFAKSVADDALTLGAVVGAAGKAVRLVRGAKVAKNVDIFNKLNIDDIAALNKKFSNGQTMQGKDISTVLANASYREGGINQAASVIRDIAGGHLFQNGNKRTAQALVESFDLGISSK